MKKLSKEEASKSPLLKKGRSTRLSKMLATLEPGEGLDIIQEEDWTASYPPYRIINRFAKKHKWKITSGRLPGEKSKGWRVIRNA
jgi:hypothetical protein